MDKIKQICQDCGETIELLDPEGAVAKSCPRCGRSSLQEFKACSVGVEAPSWEFRCRHCRASFRVKSPSGPDEVKQIRCPVCGSREVKWMALATGACASGG